MEISIKKIKNQDGTYDIIQTESLDGLSQKVTRIKNSSKKDAYDFANTKFQEANKLYKKLLKNGDIFTNSIQRIDEILQELQWIFYLIISLTERIIIL